MENSWDKCSVCALQSQDGIFSIVKTACWVSRFLSYTHSGSVGGSAGHLLQPPGEPGTLKPSRELSPGTIGPQQTSILQTFHRQFDESQTTFSVGLSSKPLFRPLTRAVRVAISITSCPWTGRISLNFHEHTAEFAFKRRVERIWVFLHKIGHRDNPQITVNCPLLIFGRCANCCRFFGRAFDVKCSRLCHRLIQARKVDRVNTFLG